MSALKILIVDDEVERWSKTFKESLEAIISAAELAGNGFTNYEFTFAKNQQEADRAVAEAGPAGFDFVFLDLVYPILDEPVDENSQAEYQGMKWLPVLRSKLPDTTIIVLTAFPDTHSLQNIVTAIRDCDANDYIPKTESVYTMVPRIRVAYETAQRVRQLRTVEREFFSLLRTRAARSQTYAEDVAALLSRAKTALHRIAQRIESGDTSAIVKAAATIRSEFEYLNNEFDDLTSVLNKGQEALTVVDVGAEIRLMMYLYQRMINEAEVEVIIQDAAQSVLLKTYQSDLKVALHEVITNALESLQNSPPHPSEGRRLLMSVEKVGEDAIIHVADNGPGFCDSAMAHMFERGFTTRGGNHQGLGLYITKRMMNQIGGDVEARNGREGGAEVHLTVKNLGDL